METATALRTAVIARLIDLLKVLGVSQHEIARRAGVKQPFVSQWARGVRPVPDHHRLLLLTLLKETWQQYLKDTDINSIVDAVESGAVPNAPAWLALNSRKMQEVREALDAYNVAVHRLSEHEHPGSDL